jgi:mono/diheme cytochrome c family protein
MPSSAFKTLLLAALLFGVSGYASGRSKAIDFGEMAYRTSCADCHGTDGRGDGPRAAELKVKPADLSIEAKNNNGEFPFDQVYDIIDGRKPDIAAHPRHMPAWGQAFLSFGPDSQGIPRNRITAIIGYLKGLQVK